MAGPDAKREAERREQAEAEERRRRFYDFPRPPTRIEMTPWGTFREVDARDPDDISPGFIRPGVMAPTANQRKAAAERERLRKKEEEARKAEHRAEVARREAVEKVRAEETVSVMGVRMPAKNVRINP